MFNHVKDFSFMVRKHKSFYVSRSRRPEFEPGRDIASDQCIYLSKTGEVSRCRHPMVETL